MAYQALYRTYRPKTFAEVAGQEAVTRTLRKQVESGQTSHAYLFTGTRGTGKTTCAKILARAVNCEAPLKGEPCNACASCLAILRGDATDIMEFDAASHSGVDNIRALRDETVYSPAAMKKRVYIIDEVHMLSIGAFNALLTILEEPPAHVLFILATTETHKVPATILSRCQKYHFKRIAQRDIAARLMTVATAEGLSLPEDSANLLAVWGDGSLRDALSLLDRCVTLPELTQAAIEQALGLAGTSGVTQLAEAVGRGDAAQVLSLFSTFYADGKEASALVDELRGLLHRMLVTQVLNDNSRPLTDEQRALLPLFSPQRLTHSIGLLQETLAALPRSVNVRIDAELCLLKITDAALSALLAPQAKTTDAPAKPHAPTGKPSPQAKTPKVDELPVRTASTASSGVGEIQWLGADWKTITNSLQAKVSPSELSHLQLAHAARSDNKLIVYPDSALALMLLNKEVVISKIAEAAKAVFEQALVVKISGEQPQKPAPQAQTDSDDPLDGLMAFADE